MTSGLNRPIVRATPCVERADLGGADRVGGRRRRRPRRRRVGGQGGGKTNLLCPHGGCGKRRRLGDRCAFNSAIEIERLVEGREDIVGATALLDLLLDELEEVDGALRLVLRVAGRVEGVDVGDELGSEGYKTRLVRIVDGIGINIRHLCHDFPLIVPFEWRIGAQGGTCRRGSKGGERNGKTKPGGISCRQMINMIIPRAPTYRIMSHARHV